MSSSVATRRRSGTWLSLLLIFSLASSFLLPSRGAQAALAGTALQFNGSNQYVTLGSASQLRSATFTVELWFKRTGAGVASTSGTGSGGIANPIPLITKGRAEAETANADVNYFFGIDATSGKLVADFEEAQVAQGGTTPGLNHPITGTAIIAADGTWHHAAATYDGTTWNLYLDGVLDGTLFVGRPANALTNVLTSVGSARTTTGVASGFFAGVVDEVRIWNVARSLADINTTKNIEITGAQANLLGVWNLNEGTGSSLGDSSGNSITGATVGGPTWVNGFPDPTPPAAPQNLAAAAGNTLVTLTWSANTETDLAGYNVYRSTSSPVPTTGTPLNGATLLTSNSYTDNGLANGTTYYYAVTAADTSTNRSSASNEASTTPQASAGAALSFDGTNDNVTFGAAPGLGSATFTLETWFKRTGAGVGTTTGSGGIASAIPLVTKGRAEAEGSNVDMNYFLGIDAGTGVLVADFEEGPGGTGPLGQNHPISGVTVATSNAWHHAAATYDGTTWKLYLDGVLDKQHAVGQPPRSDSIQHAALATAMTSSGVAAGFFQGTLDEARIWNYARTSAQIQATMNTEIPSATGLLGRWGMNEGSGTVVGSSAGSINGTATNGPLWVAGYAFTADTTPPTAPQNLNANAGDGSITLTWSANAEPDLAGYNLYRGTSSPVSTTGTPLNGATLLTNLSYTDDGLTNDLTYYYVVTAVDLAANTSSPSAEASAIPEEAPPAAPQNLAATGGNGSVMLTWSANTEADLAGYNVYRNTSSPVSTGSGPLNGATLLTGPNYTDNSATNGTTYHYAVTAVDTGANESNLSAEASATPQAFAGKALQFNGSSQYVTFGQALGLDAATFTIETWFNWTGGGIATSTGTGGVTAIPLVTKGRAESEGSSVDMNYFLGIQGGVLVADFEEGPGGAGPLGQNHPVTGATSISTNTWHHAAATYDGTTWKLYLDGVLDTQLVVGQPPRADSTQHAALGTAMTSTGAAAGYFAGVLDEARIWNIVRTQAQIQAAKDVEITAPTAGLIGRWGLNEGTGATVGDSSGSGINGTAVGSPTWVSGFVVPSTNGAPAAPTLNAPADAATNQATSLTLDVTVSDPDGTQMTVTFYGRPYASGVFAVIATKTGVASGGSATAQWQNLGTGQKYEWYVTVGDGTATTTGPTWTLTTAPGSDPVFVGAGDIAECNNPGDEATALLLDGIAGNVFTAGDNAYLSGSETEYANCYDPSWGRNKARTRPAAGNHEWVTSGARGYFGYFGSAAGPTNSGYYSYDIGTAWHVIILDSECTQVQVGGCQAGSPQELWLRSDLAANPTKNVIAIWHKPRFSSGSTNLTEVQSFWDALYEYGADIMLTGHDHVYERFAPMNPAGQADATFGMRQFTVGTGGQSHHSFGTVKTTSQVRNNDTFGVLKLTLHASSYDWQFFPVAGKTFSDSGTAATHGRPGNAAPVVDSVSINQSNPTTNDTLSATVASHDPDGDPITHAYQWTKNGVDIAGATSATLNLALVGNGDKGDLIRVRVTASDGAASSAPVTSNPVTVANTAPVVDSVTIAPAAPQTNQTLSVAVTSHDADGDSRTYTYQWTKSGADIPGATGATLDLSSAGNGDKGDAVGVRVAASDGSAISAAATSAPVTVVNSAPVATVGLSNAAPATNDTLTATATRSDADNDPVTLTYVWKVNGLVQQTTANSSGLTDSFDLSVAGHGNNGDTVTVEVTPSDGSADGTLVSASAMVGSTAPVVDSATIDQANPKTNDTLSVTVVSHDPDGDPTITYAYQWIKNGVDLAGATGASLNLATAGNGDKGDQIRVRVTASDGSATGAPLTSGPVTMVNSAPSATVALNTDSAGTDATLTATATRSDADSEAVTLTYVWKVNGTIKKTTASSSSLADTFDLSTSGNGDNGDTVTVEVTPNDGTTDGAQVSDAAVIVDSALAFDGTNDYVTFGSAPGLDAASFTLETWFKRTGAGVGTSTGTGGIANAIPLVTKGRAEAEGSNVDMNYFLGIDASTGVLVGDFEDMATGANHPVSGVTVVSSNVWHHAALTYDGSTWKLYLDGVLDKQLAVGQTPRSDSIQHAALATAMNSTGVAAGFFQGTLDESRIWNLARSGAQIRSSKDQPIASAAGLLGRWGLNEGAGTTVTDSSGSGLTGTLTNSPTWVAGYDFPADASAPAAPQNLTANSAEVSVMLGWTANTETDLAGYNIYRSTSSPVSTSGTPINGADLVRGTSYTDDNLTNGTTYHYVVVAVDGSNNASSSSTEVSATPQTPPEGAFGLELGSGSAYVTFGDPGKLDLGQFTIETWFKRTGAGVSNTTGTNGIASAIPLVTHGAPQADGSNVDANWILAIDDATDVIAADFEDMATGANHPVRGTTIIANDVWHHAAATYDGSTWRLYLDGNLETTLTVNAAPRSDTIQRAGLGTMIESGGATHGHFQGVLDEVRVWNRALGAADIQVGVNQQLVSGSGLVARWGLNEGSGTTVGDSLASPANGTITGVGSGWMTGAPFNVTSNSPPAQPTLNAPTNGATGVSTSPTLDVDVSDPDADNLTVTFYGRPAAGGPAPGPDFTLIALPDTQYYASSLNGGSPAIFNSQTQWIVDNLGARNIVFVTQLGDCTEHGDQFEVEWQNADTAFKTIENSSTTGMTDGMPYGIAPGNHDQTPTGDPTNGSTTLYNQYFGIARFQGRGYYGGHYGDNNDNHYELFSASGLDFIVVHLEYDPSATAAVLTWADDLLKTYSNRRAIVVSHYIINGGTNASFGTQGQAIYNALKNNPNLFLMLSGHVTSPVEGQRQDTFNGHTIYSLMSDYQARTNGGNGWLRIYEFSPANNQIRVKTYSPWLGQFETDADSQFTLAYDMAGSAPFQAIGTSTVPSGSNATVAWPGLSESTDYEWYATVSDGRTTTTGPTWTFTTQAPANHPPVASDQPATTAEDTAKAITVNATDADGDSLTYSVVDQPQHGTLSGTAPALNYTPAANYNGLDSFTFKANDGTADSNTATVSIDVTPVNDAPSFSKGADQTVAEDAGPQSVTGWATNITAGPADEASQIVDFVVSNNNTALFAVPPAVAADGTLSYTPEANANGSASVTVRVHDNGGTANGGVDTSTAQTFTVTVTPINDAPVASGQAVTTAEDTAKGIMLSATDVENSPLTYTVLSVPSHGTLTGNGPNRTYTPAANYNGPDSFTFKANDGTADSNVATVSINVTPVNDAPVASGQSVSADQGVATTITLSASDVDGDSLTYSVVAGPAHGTLSGTAPNLSYTSAPSYSGSDSFTFKAYDGTVDSNIASVSITIVDRSAPATPTGLNISLSSIAVSLDWNDNTEPDRAGYNVYRSASAGGPFTKLNASLLSSSQYNDTSAPGGTSYYRVTAVDTSGNESTPAVTNVSRIAFRAATSAKTTNKKLTISKPAGLATGDVMLASIAIASNATTTAPAGWASIGTLTSGSMRQTIYWHVAAASEPASYLWSFTANQNATGAIVAYSGANATTPTIYGGQANAISTSITAPSVTTVASNSLVVGFFGIAASTTVSPPSGMLEQTEISTQASAKSKVTTEIADSIQAAIGPSQSKIATAGAAAANVGQLVALQPK